MKNVSIDHAAKIMAVSSATIRNWAKAGHIKPVSTRPLLFSEESVLSLKSQIGLGTFGRLQTRANKAGAVSSFLPAEYTDNPHLISHIADLVSIIKDECLEIEAVIFVATLRLLEINGEVKKKCQAIKGVRLELFSALGSYFQISLSRFRVITVLSCAYGAPRGLASRRCPVMSSISASKRELPKGCFWFSANKPA